MADTKHPGPLADPNGEHAHVHPGGEVHGHGVRAASTAVNNEVTDIPLAGTTRAALISAGAIGVVMLLMWGAWGFFLSQARSADPGRPPMAAQDFGDRLPAAPRLQAVPGSDLAGYRAEQNAKIQALDWVDQGAGTVRIPIGSAMQLIVNRADAFADQQARPPADHSWSEPGAAQLERLSQPAAPPLPHGSPSPAGAPGQEQRPQPGSTAPSEQDKPQAPAAPPHE
jgi:hypothetical protein